jgi:hypothetical protein
MDQEEMTFDPQILAQMSEHHLMPFEGFRTMPSLAMSLEVFLDRSFYRQALTFRS